MVINIKSIDWDYIAIDIGQVWGEAVAAYRAGEPFNLTADEHRQRIELNERHEVENPYESLVTSKFVIDPTQTGEGWLMTAPGIMKILDDRDAGNRARIMSLSTALETLGLAKDKAKRTVNGERGRFWAGIRPRP